jgi:hypothetical protein
MVISEEIISITEYLPLYTTCDINRCRYNRAGLCINTEKFVGNKIIYWTIEGMFSRYATFFKAYYSVLTAISSLFINFLKNCNKTD